MNALKAGSRVITVLGVGTVVYVRMGPPDYATPTAVSVVLDHRHGYHGTLFFASQVRPFGPDDLNLEDLP